MDPSDVNERETVREQLALEYLLKNGHTPVRKTIQVNDGELYSLTLNLLEERYSTKNVTQLLFLNVMETDDSIDVAQTLRIKIDGEQREFIYIASNSIGTEITGIQIEIRPNWGMLFMGLRHMETTLFQLTSIQMCPYLKTW